MLNAIADTVFDVPLKHDLSAAVKCRFGGVDLGEDILARYVLVDHPVNGLYLTNDFFQTAVQVIRIHALFHIVS